MENELKQCPFCRGDSALFKEMIERDTSFIIMFFVICLKCKAKTAYYLKEIEAVEYWNTRVDDEKH